MTNRIVNGLVPLYDHTPVMHDAGGTRGEVVGFKGGGGNSDGGGWDSEGDERASRSMGGIWRSTTSR